MSCRIARYARFAVAAVGTQCLCIRAGLRELPTLERALLASISNFLATLGALRRRQTTQLPVFMSPQRPFRSALLPGIQLSLLLCLTGHIALCSLDLCSL